MLSLIFMALNWILDKFFKDIIPSSVKEFIWFKMKSKGLIYLQILN